MDKFIGMIGFVSNVEIEDGITEDEVTERKYRGDILKNNQRFNTTNTTSGEIKISNRFSIIADSYAFDHIADIRYLTWRGNRWIVEYIDIEYPRLVMSIGGLYNGPQAGTAEDSGED